MSAPQVGCEAAACRETTTTTLSAEVAQLHEQLEATRGQLLEAQERADRLGRAVGTEAKKRADSQDKGRRLLGERLQLEAELACLKLKRRRTAATLRAFREEVRGARACAAFHLRASTEARGQLAALQGEQHLLHAHATSTALSLARVVGQLEAMKLRHQALVLIHQELRTAQQERVQRLTAQLAQAQQERDEAILNASAAAERAHRLEGLLGASEAREEVLQEQLHEASFQLSNLGAQLEAAGEQIEPPLLATPCELPSRGGS
jgi:chromosome segregation ATPase